MTDGKKVFLVKSRLLGKADTQKNLIEDGLFQQVIELTPSELELMKAVLEYMEFGAVPYSWNDKKLQDNNKALLKKLESL